MLLLFLLPGCTPQKCGRAVTDAVVTREEAEVLRRLAERGLALAGSEGGASILDLHSGALSMGKQFVNIYSQMSPAPLHHSCHIPPAPVSPCHPYPSTLIKLILIREPPKIAPAIPPTEHPSRYFGDQIDEVFTQEDFQLYRDVRRRIQETIAHTFALDENLLFLTKPTFFSRINSTEAKTQHDEYWHPHIDKVTYGSFDYTSLLYLADYGSDFTGGRFIFMDQDGNRTVEPRAGTHAS
ncbi:hypothetical protein NL108_013406 [Boleophthalmus pectinirostris]|nr:hypothetical protein NL108_013406 [Boleophthalmus pectinirostris]